MVAQRKLVLGFFVLMGLPRWATLKRPCKPNPFLGSTCCLGIGGALVLRPKTWWFFSRFKGASLGKPKTPLRSHLIGLLGLVFGFFWKGPPLHSLDSGWYQHRHPSLDLVAGWAPGSAPFGACCLGIRDSCNILFLEFFSSDLAQILHLP